MHRTSRIACAIFVFWVLSALILVYSGYPARYLEAAKGGWGKPSDDNPFLQGFETFIEKLPGQLQTFQAPIVIALFSKSVNESTRDRDSLLLNNFYDRLVNELEPCGSCFDPMSTPQLVQKLERPRSIAKVDGSKENAFAVQVWLCRQLPSQNLTAIDELCDRLRDEVIPKAKSGVVGFSERFVDSIVLDFHETHRIIEDAALYDFGRSDLVGTVLAMTILFLAVGPLAGVVFILVPLSLLVMAAGLGLFTADLYFTSLGPAIFSSLAFALSLDYSLFILWRFLKDLRDQDWLLDETSVRNAVRSAVTGSVRSAGFVIFSSGVILTAAFLSLYFGAKVDEVKTLGLGGAMVVTACVITSLTVVPAVIFTCISCCSVSCFNRMYIKIPAMTHGCCAKCCCCGNAGGRADAGLGIARLGIEWPWSTIFATVLFSAPCVWSTMHCTPTVDWNLILPPGEFPSTVTRLGRAGIPPGVLLPQYIAVWPQEDAITNCTMKDILSDMPSQCDDHTSFLKEQLRVFLTDKDVRKVPTCKLLRSRMKKLPFRKDFCKSTFSFNRLFNKTERIPYDFGNESETLDWVRLTCPKQCGMTCSLPFDTVLSRCFFAELQNLEATVLKHVREIGGDEAVNQTNIMHIGKLGDQALSAPVALSYLFDTCSRNDFGKASEYRRSFARLANIRSTATMMQLELPFQPMTEPEVEFAHALHRSLAKMERVNATLFADVDALIYTKNDVYKDLPSDSLAAAVILLVIMALVYRSLVLPVRLLITTLLAVAWAVGVTAFIYKNLLGFEGLYWLMLPSVLPITVGLALDYDLFILMHVLEYRFAGYSTISSVRRGIANSQVVISIAGLLMACAFSTMIVSKLPVLQQFGMMLVLGALWDAFVGRPLIVPACMLALSNPEWNWWPRRLPPITEFDFSELPTELEQVTNGKPSKDLDDAEAAVVMGRLDEDDNAFS